MYIPPNFHLETEHLDTLLKQLPSPYILVGDFNGHNILWGCKDNNPKGNIIEDFITKNDLCFMNDKSHTYLHPATRKFSSLDLSMCHPSLLLDFDWTVSKDQHGSDHFPVLWVLNFPPCRGPGGSIPTGNVASLVSSNCPLWEELRGNTTRLPWVAARKPEEGILEVESYWEFGLS